MRTTAARARADSRHDHPHGPIACSREVRQALDRRQPVVALESTIIAHGLPKPENFDMACEFESIVREEGACPATIAVVDGEPRVGLDIDELARIAAGVGVRTLGLRDLALAPAQRATAATTVSATAFLAARAGIRVFATGGLRGVHRKWTDTWDESAATRPSTWQRLEILSVGVVGYRNDGSPGFRVRGTGRLVPRRTDGPTQIATLMREQDELGAGSTMLIANPVADGDLAAVRGNIRLAAQVAVAWADESGWPDASAPRVVDWSGAA